VIQNTTFVKIQDGGSRHLENTETGVSQPILDRFAQYLVCCFILAIRGLLGAKISIGWEFKIAVATLLDFVFQPYLSRQYINIKIFASNLVGE